MITKRYAIILVCVVYVLGLYTGYSYHDAVNAKLQIENKQDKIMLQQKELSNRYYNHSVNTSGYENIVVSYYKR